MRILQLVSSGGMYGAENVILNLMVSLRPLGVDTILGVFRNTQNPHTELADIAAGKGFEVEVIPCRGRFDLGALRQVQGSLQKRHVDVAHTHGYKANLYGYLAGARTRVPVIATCHNWTDDTKAVRFYSMLDRFCLRRSKKVVAVSVTVASKLSMPASVVEIIPNGVFAGAVESPAISEYGGVPVAGRMVIGMCGRLVPQKGFHFALEAAAELVSTFPQLLIVLVGAGPEKQTLENLVVRLGLGSHVVFAGERSDMQAVYRSLDLFVTPSLNEGMPMTVLEAMANGVPVIASRIAAIPELLQGGEAGVLVAPGDVLSLVEGFNRMLSNSDFRRSIGRRGQAVVERSYSADVMARRYLEVYEKVLGSDGQLAFAR